MSDYNVLVGGAAGQGVETLAGLLEKAFHRHGLWVFGVRDYMSRIRGGHNFAQVRVADRPLHGPRRRLDAIIALNEETVRLHRDRLAENGRILADAGLGVTDPALLALPLERTARELGDPRVVGSLALGAVAASFGLDRAIIEEILAERFAGETLAINVKALHASGEWATRHFPLPLPPRPTRDRILVTGAEALGLGVLAAGCTFGAWYPMTPATPLMTFLADRQAEAGMVVEQAEDEIAAINMALGAAYAGARALCATSGGGFSLMVEGLSLAGMTETPVVIVLMQRPGPATGFPTRTEQGDLAFALTAGHGEFPRLVTALRTPDDAFRQAARAFNLAEKYQLPAILLGDQFLTDYVQSMPPLDFGSLVIERQLLAPAEVGPDGDYLRYDLTESGISPRLLPGKAPGQVVMLCSDEHTPRGNITEAADVRAAMVDKRMRKHSMLRQEVEEPEFLGEDGPVLFVAWGSTGGPLREAVETLNAGGRRAGALVFGDLWPLPTGRLREKAPGKLLVNVEQNHSGQLARLVRQETGIVCDRSLLKYDGRPFTADEIVAWAREEVL
ncbi:MAG TPA: 2-oxoacid:acceptor oxidoreductase subunit alpha [Bacillota bacterium]|nr:2-oxoacid:acceptor oxidoreductase subunit alpha [Bacillota bacterium]